MKTAKPFPRSACAIANSLDILGDKWSLLVVRDLLHGKRTYGEGNLFQPIWDSEQTILKSLMSRIK